MTLIKSLCVYCGSGSGHNPHFASAARELGRDMAERKVKLIYGGARIGLMGAVADACLSHGGEVTGIIPSHLDEIEVGHRGLTELKVVESMHIRKKLMFDLSDGFVILPGGLGTLDEFFEILTWRQLQLHDKPVVLLNLDGYWDPLLSMMDHIVETGFARAEARQHFSVIHQVSRLFDILRVPMDTAIAEQSERF